MFLILVLLSFRQNTNIDVAIFEQAVLSCVFGLGFELFAGCVNRSKHKQKEVNVSKGKQKEVFSLLTGLEGGDV